MSNCTPDTTHPCYNQEAHGFFARIHLPVAPACNIQCNYCNRKYDCSNESRPGVTTAKLSYVDAVKKTLFVGSKIRNLSVAGIAGPGDAIANPEQTFGALELLAKHAPDLTLCISTNGLMLPFYAKRLKECGVNHLTVTLNTVDPKIGANIYSWVYDTKNKKRYKGEEGAELLLNRQLKGIEECVRLGIAVKINSVLIPGVNEDDLPNVASRVRALGVHLHNIMPLLSEPEFDTYFSNSGVKSATDEQVEKARSVCGLVQEQMTHCRQCRADAIGILGEDRSSEFEGEGYAKNSIESLAIAYDLDGKIATKQALVEKQKRLVHKNSIQFESKGILVAVTSRKEGMVDLHFGEAKEFVVYEINNGSAKAIGIRRLRSSYCHGESDCSDTNPIAEILEKLKGIDYLVTAKVGPTPSKKIQEAGVKILQCEGASMLDVIRLVAPLELEAN